MRSTWLLAAGTVLWLACSKPETPAPPAVASAAGPLEYPTFEIFRSSRMFKLLEEDLGQRDFAEMAGDMTKLGEIQVESKEAAESFVGLDKDGRPSALLSPQAPEASQGVYCVVPVVMIALEPLWKAERWTEEQVQLASQCAKVVGLIPGAPSVEFAAGDDARNRTGLEQLVAWFHAAKAKRECLAAMIFTMDDGPYVGLAFEAAAPLRATDQRSFGASFELRLAKTEREDERWVMQCVRDGKVQWSRVISGMPDGSVRQVEFLDGVQPKPLGEYGWHVPFLVEWPMGREQAHMYLDARGELLFYYLSW